MSNKFPSIIWLADIDPDEHEIISNFILRTARLYQSSFPILPGFVITPQAFRDFIDENNLGYKIQTLLGTVDIKRPESLMQGASLIKRLLDNAHLPEAFIKELKEYYIHLNNDVRVRTHLSAKHGYKEHEAEITTYEQLANYILERWIEHFDANAIAKRHRHSLDHIQDGMEIFVQAQIQPEKHGKIYTIHPHSHDKQVMMIETKHSHAQDRYEITKKGLTVIKRTLKHHSEEPKLTLDELMSIAQLGKEIESHLYFPQEIEWGIIQDKLYILRITPVSENPQQQSEEKIKLPIARGTTITAPIASGQVKIIVKDADLDSLKPHHILVATDLEPYQMKKIKHIRGVIIESGERHSELAAFLRQQGIPALFHVKDATKNFKAGHHITIHAGKGEIYHGGHL